MFSGSEALDSVLSEALAGTAPEIRSHYFESEPRLCTPDITRQVPWGLIQRSDEHGMSIGGKPGTRMVCPTKWEKLLMVIRGQGILINLLGSL